ncbi:MAG: hypothetical protein AB1816_20980, partial [Bacillota bacterium]
AESGRQNRTTTRQTASRYLFLKGMTSCYVLCHLPSSVRVGLEGDNPPRTPCRAIRERQLARRDACASRGQLAPG